MSHQGTWARPKGGQTDPETFDSPDQQILRIESDCKRSRSRLYVDDVDIYVWDVSKLSRVVLAFVKSS